MALPGHIAGPGSRSGWFWIPAPNPCMSPGRVAPRPGLPWTEALRKRGSRPPSARPEVNPLLC